MFEWILLCVVFFSAWMLTGLIRHSARHMQLIDQPNARSSHTLPTPRGGGLSIVLCFSAVLIFCLYNDIFVTDFISGLLVSSAAIALVSFWDDRLGLGVTFRFIVQILCSLIFIFFIPGWPDIPFPGLYLQVGLFTAACYAIALVWLVNLYNFMDGIDGLAASEAVFVALAGAVFLFAEGQTHLGWLLVFFASACGGFLVFNWPPAKIFMGDVGSAYIGFVLGALAIYLASATGVNIWVWLILLSVFWIDASLTLVWRMATGQPWRQAHRLHAYQQLAIHWNSHARVTVAAWLVNLLWLLPLAFTAYQCPAYGSLFALIATCPLILIVCRFGMKRPA